MYVCDTCLVIKLFSFFFSHISGITTVLTLSTISLDSRTDLPKVHYATALDWFIICCFGYCSATLLQFAGVHYFTKVIKLSFFSPLSHISGITTVLTLSTIALDSRTDLPKVHYATALDWFIICCFGYCIATLLQFAGVHYFTKVFTLYRVNH